MSPTRDRLDAAPAHPAASARLQPVGRSAPHRDLPESSASGPAGSIPGECPHEVARRVAALRGELAPGGEAMALLLVDRLATLSVRVERSGRHEAAVTADRVRQAAHQFDEARQTEADDLLATIDRAPATNYRRLRAMPEGVDRLIQALAALRARVEAIEAEVVPGWLDQMSIRFAHLTGQRDDLGTTNWSHANPVCLDAAQVASARAELVIRIGAEVDRLGAHRATLDTAAIALSRAEAGDRALVDTGPAATRARQYEAAMERSLFRILRELRELRASAAKAAVAHPETTADQAAAYAQLLTASGFTTPLGSFFPGSDRSPSPWPDPAAAGSPPHPAPPRRDFWPRQTGPKPPLSSA